LSIFTASGAWWMSWPFAGATPVSGQVAAACVAVGVGEDDDGGAEGVLATAAGLAPPPQAAASRVTPTNAGMNRGERTE